MPQSTVSLQTDRHFLYSRCEDRERKFRAWNSAAFKNQFVSALAFGVPLFSSSNTVTTPLGRTRKGRKLDLPPSRYMRLVQTLKNAENKDELWFFLALWLKQEAIREPKDFLPPATYARLTRKDHKRLRGISFSDMRYFELVRCWEPYFSKLLEDCKRLRYNSANLEKELSTLGYVPKSVELVLLKRRRSAVEISCVWLADRGVIRSKNKNPDPVSTLRNAYSRIKAGALLKSLRRPKENRLSHRHDRNRTK